jgi:HEPN domain-containing protein
MCRLFNGRYISLHSQFSNMIARTDLKQMARAKLLDAEVLLRNKRYDSAAYLCGYSVELALKAQICATLKWTDFPESQKEFEHYRSFKTHSLDVLLRLSARLDIISGNFIAPWSTVATWSPEDRYKPVGSVSHGEALAMIDSARTILEAL